MEQIFFDEIGKDGLRYIAGWNKTSIAFSEKQKIGFWNHNRIGFHLREKKSQIESIREGHDDFYKYNLLKKITIPKTEHRNKIEILLFERDKEDENPFVFMYLLICGNSYNIDYQTFERSDREKYQKAKAKYLSDFDITNKDFEERLSEVLEGLKKEQVKNIDTFTRTEEKERKEMPYSEAEIKSLECDLLIVCKKCGEEIVDYFESDKDFPRLVRTPILKCKCGAKYSISIETEIKTRAREMK